MERTNVTCVKIRYVTFGITVAKNTPKNVFTFKKMLITTKILSAMCLDKTVFGKREGLLP